MSIVWWSNKTWAHRPNKCLFRCRPTQKHLHSPLKRFNLCRGWRRGDKCYRRFVKHFQVTHGNFYRDQFSLNCWIYLQIIFVCLFAAKRWYRKICAPPRNATTLYANFHQNKCVDGNFCVGSCLITGKNEKEKKSKKQFSMAQYFIAFNLCKLKWEETEQSSGNSFLFERLNICIFLSKMFDYVAVENTLKAALRSLQFIMFKAINSTICEIFLSNSMDGTKNKKKKKNRAPQNMTARNVCSFSL